MRIFYLSKPIEAFRTTFSSPIELQAAGDKALVDIPDDLLYITTASQISTLKKDSAEFKASVRVLTEAREQEIKSRAQFPADLGFRGFKSIQDLLEFCQRQQKAPRQLNIGVFNGMGSALGDNVGGIAAIQRFRRLLDDECYVHFHLFQRYANRNRHLYRRLPYISASQLPVTLSSAMAMDCYVDLNNLLSMPEFNDLAMVDFLLHALSVRDLVTDTDKTAKLPYLNGKRGTAMTLLNNHFKEERELVYFHAHASTPLRSLTPEKSRELLKGLIELGRYNIVTTADFDMESEYLINIKHVSKNTDDLLHIIACCDAVVTVDTLSLHFAASLGKPTLLFATTESGFLHAENMPSVYAYADDSVQQLASPKHKSREDKDIEVVADIWQRIKVEKCVAKVKRMLQRQRVLQRENARGLL